MQQKTIFLSIYNGIRAKNFFHTDVYRELVKDPNIRLVIAIPSSKYDYYRKVFPESNVIFEPLDIVSEPWLGRLLAEIAFNAFGTRTIVFKQKLEYWRYKKRTRFLVKRMINIMLTPFQKIVRRLIRWLDCRLVAIDPDVAELLDRYKPDLVLAPDIVFPLDRIFLRAARRKGYFVVGLTRSWDNLTSKGVIQILPDKLILHTSRMKHQAVELVGMPADDIYVSGPPDYDKYFKPLSIKKEDFCRSLGIDPSRRLILFSSFYDEFNGSAVIMINTLLRAIKDGRLPNDIHVVVRYRPSTPEILDNQIDSSDHITITKPCSYFFRVKNRAQAPTKDWEFSPEDVDLLVHSISFSSVVISTYSTITIDAAAAGRPVIGVRFDADPTTAPQHSVVRIADAHDHYRELEQAGAVRLVYSNNDLIDAVNFYLEHPEADREGRKKIVRDQIEFTDGLNGKRAADFIKKMLKERPRRARSAV